MQIWMIILWVLAGIVGFFLYFIPTYVAVKNNHPNKGGIFLVNLLLGVTVLGWVAALIWATSGVRHSRA